ncbi:MAG: hypothetical protein KKF33_06965 [Alphaproteobacteria bacterium]|nr:hypothetical protein [Alphaproteobacteria bacterium]
MPRNFPPASFGKTAILEGNEVAAFEDYVEVGKKIVEWVNDPSKRPTDTAGLNSQIGAHYQLPPKVQGLEIIDGDDVTFKIRLPAKGQVNESLELARQGQYAVPPVVRYLNEVSVASALQTAASEADKLAKEMEQAAKSAREHADRLSKAAAAAAAVAPASAEIEDVLYARVADYTMRQCR